MNADSQPDGNERRIINGLLIVCIVLGFVSLAAVYLPHHLRSMGNAAQMHAVAPSSLTSVVPTTTEMRTVADAPRSTPEGPLFRFVPEGEPQPPAASAASMAAVTRNKTTRTRDGDDVQPAASGDAGLPEPSAPELATFGSHAMRAVRHRISSLVDGSARHTTVRGKRWWDTPPGFEADVAFWRDIFATHDSNHVVLHDSVYLQVVYDVLDFTAVNTDPALTDERRRAIRRERVRESSERIVAMHGQLDTNREAAVRTPLGRTIVEKFATIDEPHKYRKAAERGVRSQTGQRDKFLEGLRRSGAYLGEIEFIFASYGLPRELTRLIFVESMFQMGARSKVGAGGIWQFMPGTGKRYLQMNRFIDERFDPIMATHAAARYLKLNYDELGTWPLALNAYNAGRGRLKQAVATLGTDDIGVIIRRFKHPAYGFASRNFFLEFVAAREVVDNAEHYFGKIEFDKPLSYDVIETPFHVSLVEISGLAGLSMVELRELNPAFDGAIFSGDIPLPRGSTLRLPVGSGKRFLEFAQRGLKTNTAPLMHTVADGESLGSIARMYGVPLEHVREANPSAAHKPRRGQRIVIPFD